MRIVIVEDEAAIRNGLEHVLQKIHPDYEVAGTAPDGKSGLELIRRLAPDLVIADIRMPDMDGLTMLAHLRREGNTCRALILSAYSDFDYAKRAIELGVDGYLLKPVKFQELKEKLALSEKNLQKERQERRVYSPEKVLLAAAGGHVENYAGAEQWLREEHGISPGGEIGVLVVWLGNWYETYKEAVFSSLSPIGKTSGKFESCVCAQEKKNAEVVILYCISSWEEVVEYLRSVIVPMLGGVSKGHAVTALNRCCGLEHLEEAANEAYAALEYHLTEGMERLICCEEIPQMEMEQFPYPVDLEMRTRQAAAGGNYEELLRCGRNFKQRCREGRYAPDVVKAGCFRYFNMIYHTVQESGILSGRDKEMAETLQRILAAVSWEELEELYDDFAREIIRGKQREKSEAQSLLVQKACSLIREFYSQGITLEETAAKLGVSPEYLSTRMKKETGMTFTETIKGCRIDRIKELLVSTNLKLIQIAEKTGYTDPKYMSRIFKEEVGMLPLEYRKIHL